MDGAECEKVGVGSEHNMRPLKYLLMEPATIMGR
jgi:hypothetical protein